MYLCFSEISKRDFNIKINRNGINHKIPSKPLPHKVGKGKDRKVVGTVHTFRLASGSRMRIIVYCTDKYGILKKVNAKSIVSAIVQIKKNANEPEIERWIKDNGLNTMYTSDNIAVIAAKLELLYKFLKSIPTKYERKQLIIKAFRSKIETDFDAAVRVLGVIYTQQTIQEQDLGRSFVHNKVGFTKLDAKHASTAMRIIIDNKGSSGFKVKDQERLCHMMVKYSEQYLKMRGVI